MDYLNEISISYKKTNVIQPDCINGSASAYNALYPHFEKDMDFRESFKVLFLNRANEVIGIYTLSVGGVSGTVVDNKILFSAALKCLASSIIVAHNHPSGKLKPSSPDLTITKKMKKAGELLDIKVLDHIILSSIGYFSFADEGLM